VWVRGAAGREWPTLMSNMDRRPRGRSPMKTSPQQPPSGSWGKCGQSTDGECSTASNAGGVAERQEAVTRCLSEITQLKLSDKGLSPDFRLQLQLLECSMQQYRLMQRLADQQQRTSAQLEELHWQGTERAELVLQNTEIVQQRLEQVRSQLEQHICPDPQPKAPSFPASSGTPSTGVALDTCISCSCPLEGPQVSGPDPALATVSAQSSVVSVNSVNGAYTHHEQPCPCDKPHLDPPWPDRAQKDRAVFDSPHSHVTKISSSSEERNKESFMERLISSTAFDLLCGAVITCNAATIGIAAQDTMVFALDNIGSGERPPRASIQVAGIFFMSFYICELLVKLWVWRLRFFTGGLAKWNIFDLMLVLVGVYDFVADKMTNAQNGANVTWMRILRLLRMLKMLRVVRVMRFFRVLRMMVNSIAGSMTTLMWSILMLALMMYIFGICFLQIISGFLADSSPTSISEDTVTGVRLYWNSVPQSIITLYYAVTGGADWEPLAQPIRDAGEMFYLLFLFYIAFTAFAVLNVLTGLYVDTATKISEQDDNSVGGELRTRPETLEFRALCVSLVGEGTTIHTSLLEAQIHNDTVKHFFALVDIEAGEMRRILKGLDMSGTGMVEIEDVIEGCIHAKSNNINMDLMMLGCESKRSRQALEAYHMNLHQRFDELAQILSEKPGAAPALSEPHRAPKSGIQTSSAQRPARVAT